MIETLLKEREERSAQAVGDTETTSLDAKPATSIADRMKSLQDAGMVVNVPKRLSKELRPSYDASTSTAQAKFPHLPSPLLSQSPPERASGSHPQAPSTRSPITRSQNAIGHRPSQSLFSPAFHGSLDDGPQAGVSKLKSPPSPSHAEPIADPGLASPSTLSFSTSYPSVDELDARAASWMFPSVPDRDPGLRNEDFAAKPSSNTLGLFPHHNLGEPPLSQPMLPRPPSRDVLSPPRSYDLHPPASPSHRSNPPSPSNVSFGEPRSSPETRPLPRRPLPDLPAASSVYPSTLSEWINQGYKILILDARTREKFEVERPQVDGIVCIEPSVLSRPG